MASSRGNPNAGPHVGKSGRYLTTAEEAKLVLFVAAKGENYGRFLDWCDMNEVPEARRFSPSYFHTWISRHHKAVVAARAVVADDVRRASTFDRDRRIRELEESCARIKADIKAFKTLEESVYDDDGEIVTRRVTSYLDQRLRLEDLLGRQTERIAKERGEFNKADAAPTGSNQMNELNRQMMQAFSPKFLAAPPDIEGEVRVLD